MTTEAGYIAERLAFTDNWKAYRACSVMATSFVYVGVFLLFIPQVSSGTSPARPPPRGSSVPEMHTPGPFMLTCHVTTTSRTENCEIFAWPVVRRDPREDNCSLKCSWASYRSNRLCESPVS